MSTYAVFGLGKSGSATVNYLLQRGDNVFAWDDKEESRAQLFSQTAHPALDAGSLKETPEQVRGVQVVEPKEWDWSNIEALVLSPGIQLTHPKPHYIVEAAKNAHKKIICDIEILYLDNKDAKFIGITGTNGKSTTTALTAHILKENGFDVAVGGNLGTAALTLGRHEYYVIEMSSYQLDLIDQTAFDIAVWINISPDHIDRHGDLAGYVKAKKNIFKNNPKTIIIGRDDEESKKVLEENKGAIAITKFDKTGKFPLLPGSHNQQNISAAYQAAKAVGIGHKNIIRAIGSFPGLEHRIENVATIAGVKYINDSKATNADSASYALACFNNIHWIIGGVAKAGGIESLQSYFPRVKKAYLIGQAAEEFSKSLDGKISYENCGNMADAVKNASIEAEAGDVVLLSPACASFDQFKNFEERGAFFKKLVLNLPTGEKQANGSR